MEFHIDIFKNKLDMIVKNFKVAPFLFVGSGLTRRYFNTPNWLELLKHFISRIAKDEYSYSMYINQARNSGDGTLNLPKLASIISEDFNTKWYQDENFRTNDVELCEQVTQGVKPLKAEMAYYIKSFTLKAKQYTAEIDLLENLCKVSSPAYLGHMA